MNKEKVANRNNAISYDTIEYEKVLDMIISKTGDCPDDVFDVYEIVEDKISFAKFLIVNAVLLNELVAGLYSQSHQHNTTLEQLKPMRYGKTWNTHEDKGLINHVNFGLSVENIAEMHLRSVQEILNRMNQLGLNHIQ